MPSPSGEHGRFQPFSLACVSNTDGAVVQRICVRSVGRNLGEQPAARAGQSRVVNLKRFRRYAVASSLRWHADRDAEDPELIERLLAAMYRDGFVVLEAGISDPAE